MKLGDFNGPIQMCQPLKENSFFGMLVAVAYITKLKKERKKRTDSENLSQT